MKKILLIILITTTYCNAQSRFTVKENTIIWQHIYQTTATNLDSLLINQLQQTEATHPLKLKDNQITGTTNWYVLNLEKPPYWASFPISYFINIAIKQNKYRVTIKNVGFNGPEIEAYGVRQKMDYKLNLGALDNGKLKTKKKVTTTLQQLDQHFLEFFKLKPIKSVDNW